MNTKYSEIQYKLVAPTEGQKQNVQRIIIGHPEFICSMFIDNPEYLDWLAEGNTPLPPDELPTE